MHISPVLRRDIYLLIAIVVTVPIAGELKFYPVNETFRISFGAPTFFFFLLLFQKIPAVLPGILTGASVVGFRILLDLTLLDHFSWASSFQGHLSSFFYYFSYSLFFYLARMDRFHNQTLIIGCIGMIIEILSDLIELIVLYLVFHTGITWGSLQEMTIIALSHSFIVLSFFNMLRLYETQVRERHIRKQNEHMLLLISNLYEESIHLQKTLQTAENITIKSYNLYQGLNELRLPPPYSVDEFTRQALSITGEVHEIKKDNQRIFAGLTKLISAESLTDYMNVHQLVDIVVRSNQKYACLLGKEIQFDYTITGSHPHYHVFTILSLMNNAVANAVEAIQDVGKITIDIEQKLDLVELRISDNGPGVTPRRKRLIFKPGFTTKYDGNGTPSTGIGLSFVKEMVEQLHGEITVQDGPEGRGATFTTRLPIDQLMEKE